MKLSQQNLLDNEEKQKAGGPKNKTTINQMTGREDSKVLLKNTSNPKTFWEGRGENLRMRRGMEGSFQKEEKSQMYTIAIAKQYR